MSNAQSPHAHKKSRPEPSDQKCPKTNALSAQSDIAGDGQNQNTPLIEYEWKPGFVIKLLHPTAQQETTSKSLFYHHSIMITETGQKGKENHSFRNVTIIYKSTYAPPRGTIFAEHAAMIPGEAPPSANGSGFVGAPGTGGVESAAHAGRRFGLQTVIHQQAVAVFSRCMNILRAGAFVIIANLFGRVYLTPRLR